MRLPLSSFALVLLALPGSPLAASAQPASAGQPRPKIVLDKWEAAYLESGKAGYARTYVEEFEQRGGKLYRTTLSLKLKVKRFNDVIDLGMDVGTTETAEGKILGTFMRHYLGKNKMLEIIGTVAGKELQLVADGKPIKSAPWSDDALGLYKQQTLLKQQNAKPGDKFDYRAFEPSVNLVVRHYVEVKDYEEVDVLGMKRKLVRVQTRPEKVQGVQLPTLSAWIDDNFEPVRSAAEIPGLGKITLFRTTKEIALAPANAATLTDIGISQYIRLKQRITQPYDTSAAVYRITFKDEESPESTFARDGRQQAKNVKGGSFELHVRSSRQASGVKAEEKPGAEFTQSSYFINSADTLVKKHAREAVGAEKDPWKKALRIERWVHDRMTVTSHEALAPADHVARTLQGDCTEFAMLTAAMCRAEGVPARTAVGLIYADVKTGPVFAFHMWTEVWIKGQWVPIDATLGKGYVGATHLKITDQSWHEERSLTPLLPVVRVLGRMNIDVLRVE
jgi:transglutaminase-like putative cysteine protease